MPGLRRALARDRKRARLAISKACGGHSADGWRKRRRRLARRLEWQAARLAEIAAAMA